MNTKQQTIKNTVIVAMLSLVLLVPGASFASAQPETKRDFTTEYNIEEDKINALYEKISTAEESVINLNKLITDLEKTKMFQKDIEMIKRVIDRVKADMETNYDKIDIYLTKQAEIEKLSIESMILDKDIQSKLNTLESKINAIKTNEETLVGINYETAKVVVLDDKTPSNDSISFDAAPGSSSSLAISESVKDQLSTEELELVEFVQSTPITCRSNTDSCIPMIGGIAIYRADSPSQIAGTIGYKATDRSGNVGFITAGHSIDYTNTNNRQMLLKDGTVAGEVKSNSLLTTSQRSGDFAFVETESSSDIIDDIIKRGRDYDVRGMYSENSIKPGVFLHKVGAASGDQTERVVKLFKYSNFFTVEGTPNGGDSGGPVFKKTGNARSTGVYIAGHMSAGLGADTMVQPAYKLNQLYGIIVAQ